MSKIIWQNSLIPNLNQVPFDLYDENFKDTVSAVLKVEIESNALKLHDPKAFRSMSRAALFLSHICFDLQPILKPYLDRSPFSVGIYCAVENGPIDAPTTAKMLDVAPEKFAEMYRKLRNPKMYLKQLPNLVPAQLGIFLNIQGIMNVYTHSEQAGIQALEQAEIDLQRGDVDAALVCSAHAFDDYMVVKRTRVTDSRVLSEGAAVLLLINEGTETNWKSQIKHNHKIGFGISDQLINLVL
jgi:3-oxoacyl-(acyl-carrier-protein) synthase